MFIAKINTLHRSPMGTITGVIYLDLNGVCFPEEGWSDFTIVICGWWLKALTAIYRGESVVAECLFMDGPYLFEVSLGERTQWAVMCARDETLFGNKKLSIEHHEQVEAAECLRRLVQVSQELLTACESRGWNDTDIKLLHSLVEAAESVLRGGQDSHT
jgi:hypothetical protein